jgi:hypothetical protein
MRLQRNGTDATCRRCGISPAKCWFSADVRLCHLADIPSRWRMSAFGRKRTCKLRSAMSAFGGKADIART